MEQGGLGAARQRALNAALLLSGLWYGVERSVRAVQAAIGVGTLPLAPAAVLLSCVVAMLLLCKQAL